jgi:isopenicillin N synthase-like dioxygenase
MQGKVAIPILDLSLADDPIKRPVLLQQLFDATFNVGFLYIQNHGINNSIISSLTDRLPSLFDLPMETKMSISKLNSPQFLGYNGYAEEITLGEKDLREQFDYATELPVVWSEPEADKKPDQQSHYDYSQLYWRLRGPNQWPPENLMPGFRQALMELVVFFYVLPSC